MANRVDIPAGMLGTSVTVTTWSAIQRSRSAPSILSNSSVKFTHSTAWMLVCPKGFISSSKTVKYSVGSLASRLKKSSFKWTSPRVPGLYTSAAGILTVMVSTGTSVSPGTAELISSVQNRRMRLDEDRQLSKASGGASAYCASQLTGSAVRL